MSSHAEVVFATKDDHLVSNLYRGSITAVPSALDIELYVWGCAHQTSDWIVFNWRERQWRAVETISGENAPSARHAHTATYFTMLGESYIAVLGGTARSPTDVNPPFADVHVYDIKQRVWLPVPLLSASQQNIETLTPRLFHSATFIEIEHNPYLVVVGGIFSDRTLAPNVPMPTMVNRRALVLPELRFYNLRLRCWSQPIYVPGRYRHSAILVPSTARDPKLMIIGGRDVKGNLANTALLIDIRGAFQTLKVPLNERPPADDHGQGVYWSWISGIVQPLGPYYGNCHVVSYTDSVVIFALPDRTSSQPSAQPARPERSRGSNPFRGPLPARNQPETRPRPSDASGDIQTGHAAWALSFAGGSTSLRDLRKLRRISQKAEAAAQSTLATPPHDPTPLTPNTIPPNQNPLLQAHLPTIPQNEWLWCGVVQSGWGTTMGGQEDLLLLMYQTGGRVFLVPVLLSALGIPRERISEAEVASGPGALSGLLCLLPSLWDGTDRMTMNTTLDPTIPPFADFALRTSTPNAPPLVLHRSILLARSAYFRALLTSGFSESRTGEITVEESYSTAYALCYWIYTASLPPWLENSSAFLRDDNFDISFSTEGHYAAHAGETLCELLIAANVRMMPTLADRVRHLLRAEHMHIPELAPLLWRASELTDVHDVEEIVQFSSPGVRQVNAGWVADIVRKQIRPPECQRNFDTAVANWCCGNDPQVRAAMQNAKEWLEPGVWNSWIEKCAKTLGTEALQRQESLESNIHAEKGNEAEWKVL